MIYLVFPVNLVCAFGIFTKSPSVSNFSCTKRCIFSVSRKLATSSQARSALSRFFQETSRMRRAALSGQAEDRRPRPRPKLKGIIGSVLRRRIKQCEQELQPTIVRDIVKLLETDVIMSPTHAHPHSQLPAQAFGVRAPFEGLHAHPRAHAVPALQPPCSSGFLPVPCVGGEWYCEKNLQSMRTNSIDNTFSREPIGNPDASTMFSYCADLHSNVAELPSFGSYSYGAYTPQATGFSCIDSNDDARTRMGMGLIRRAHSAAGIYSQPCPIECVQSASEAPMVRRATSASSPPGTMVLMYNCVPL